MREKHNRYLVTAGVLTIIYMMVPLFSFNTGETVSIFGLAIFIPSTFYSFFLGAIGVVLLAVLIFAAIPLYRYLESQKSLVVAAMVVNGLLYLFVFIKYFGWQSMEKIKALDPAFSIGAIFPIVIFLLLLAALLRIRKIAPTTD